MKYIASSLPLILGLTLCSCGSQLSSRQNTSYRSDMSIDEMRLELADVKHDLKSTQVELNLLDERVKKQTSSLSSSVKPSSEASAGNAQVASLERRIADLEKLIERTNTDLRNLSSHTNQALAKLNTLEQEVSSHEKRLDEVVKLKSTLTSISHAIGQSPSSAPISSNKTYKVKAGDSLEKIARNHQTSIASLKNLNNLKNDKIVVGQELRIPDVAP